MVKHETLTWKVPHKLGSHRKMPGIDQNVVGQIKLFQRRNAAQKFRSQQESIVGLALHHVANANQPGILCQSPQLRPDLGRLQVNPSHHSQYEWRGCSQFEAAIASPRIVCRAWTATHP